MKRFIRWINTSEEQDLKDYQIIRSYFKKNVTSYTYFFFAQVLAAIDSQVHNKLFKILILIPILIFYSAGVLTIDSRVQNFSHKKRMRTIPTIILGTSAIGVLIMIISLLLL